MLGAASIIPVADVDVAPAPTVWREHMTPAPTIAVGVELIVAQPETATDEKAVMMTCNVDAA
jgi:hypothetical protein